MAESQRKRIREWAHLWWLTFFPLKQRIVTRLSKPNNPDGSGR
jgi:hypothetical protein